MRIIVYTQNHTMLCTHNHCYIYYVEGEFNIYPTSHLVFNKYCETSMDNEKEGSDISLGT